MAEYAGIIGYFPSADSLNDAIKKAKEVGLSDVTAYLPLPDKAEIDEVDSSQSMVRGFALAGGITGIGLALFLTIATSWQFPLVVGGKSITSWPPFLVICFEMMVLFGTFGALTGFFTLSHLPHVIPEDGYHPRLAIDTYGLFVPCTATSPYRLEVEQVMREAGADDIRSYYRG